jgi:hypothetical protein
MVKKEVDMRHSRSGFLTLAVAGGMLLWASMAVTPASATLITFHFTGEVTGIGSNVVSPSDYVVGSLLQGTYTFESTTGNAGGPIVGIYPGTIQVPSGLDFQLGSYASPVSSSPPNEIRVTNGLAFDRYHVESGISGTGSGPAVNGHDPVSFDFTLVGPSSIFSDNSLKTLPPGVDSFVNGNVFRVHFAGGPSSIVSGIITNITAVPLPPAVILFGAGLVALIGLGAGNWRKRNSSLA